MQLSNEAILVIVGVILLLLGFIQGSIKFKEADIAIDNRARNVFLVLGTLLLLIGVYRMITPSASSTTAENNSTPSVVANINTSIPPTPSLSETPAPVESNSIPTSTFVVSNSTQQKLCGPNAFANNSYYTSTPIFQRPSGYTSGWITTDPADILLPDGKLEAIKTRAVIFVDDMPEVGFQNIPLADGHAQIWGCWFRSDLTSDIGLEAESELYKMRQGTPNIPTAFHTVSNNGLNTVTQVTSDQPILVRKEYTGTGTIAGYSGNLSENNLIVGIATQFETSRGCILYVLNGPTPFSFKVAEGLWEQYIISSETQKQSIIEIYRNLSISNGCKTDQINTIELP